LSNLDTTDSRAKLFIYAKAGLIGPGSVEGLRLLDAPPAKDEAGE
jgi:hypothetical protein